MINEDKIRQEEQEKAEAKVNNFIINREQHSDTLKERMNTLISGCVELKFLVGFFYFSGWRELYRSLETNEDITLKLLVGLQIDKLMSGYVIEHQEVDKKSTHDDHFDRLLDSFKYAINQAEMDNEGFYEQVHFFIKMLVSGRLIIRKTENPNHAKLYLFQLEEERAKFQGKKGVFITGSSNLTKAGLSGQEEFNVEITDYGYEDAEAYFDKLWKDAIPVTEDDERKGKLVNFIKHKSHVATVTPFEAYALILKTYLDLHQQKLIKPEVERILENIGYKKFSYQLDAVNQALNIIKNYNGVIIADVVGLGKSVIAALIAKNIGKRGMVICPPGLIGDKNLNTGWWGYVNDFKLADYNWEVESRGKLENIAEGIKGRGFEVIIIDEAHYFRNQDTAAYEALLQVCQGKKVILLTATPFNNAPTDIFSLLKLFLVPGKSGITIADNLEGVFREYNSIFKKLSYITKHYNSTKPDKLNKAQNYYKEMIEEDPPIDLDKVYAATGRLAEKIKSDISAVMIRRNRLDLKEDHEYANEVGELSTVQDPVELFFELNSLQSDFYDKIIGQYFGEEGVFTGAIYQPFTYEKDKDEDDDLNANENRSLQQQRNLYGFMRRLLVKRFESSFGAFSKSIDSFLKVHNLAKGFINDRSEFILERKLMEKLQSGLYEDEEIDRILKDFENQTGEFADKKTPKNTTVYKIDTFKKKDEFLADIDSDIELFEQLQREITALKLVENDPKRVRVLAEVKSILSGHTPTRKVIIFSEYVDTVKHLAPYFRAQLGSRVLVCEGKIGKELAKQLDQNFNAQSKKDKKDDFDVLITSDKLAEGFNLNRAGVIINYDIPWNPTKVIQRVGRINRIGTKVFDELFIYNFFPSEAGSDIVKSREIAAQKMFMIHNALGEDSKIFDADETPTAAGFFEKINESPDEDDELDISTQVRNEYNKIKQNYADIIKRIDQLPTRVKSAKAFDTNEVNVLRRKGLSLFAQKVIDPNSDKNEVDTILFQDLLASVKCELDTPRLELSKHFWKGYEAIKAHKPNIKSGRSSIDNATKAHKNLKIAIKHTDPSESELREFMQTLVKDITTYHTLSTYTLRRLVKNTPTKSKLQPFLEEVNWIKNRLGTDYLDLIKKRVAGQHVEVIISVENQSK